MEQDSNSYQKAEQAMNSLDGIRRASPAPYFYTRLWARIEQNPRNIWEKFGSFISRPAIAFATVGTILILNTMVLVNKNSNFKPTVLEPTDQSLNSAYDVASGTANNTILTIWNPEDEQSFEK